MLWYICLLGSYHGTHLITTTACTRCAGRSGGAAAALAAGGRDGGAAAAGGRSFCFRVLSHACHPVQTPPVAPKGKRATPGRRRCCCCCCRPCVGFCRPNRPVGAGGAAIRLLGWFCGRLVGRNGRCLADGAGLQSGDYFMPAYRQKLLMSCQCIALVSDHLRVHTPPHLTHPHEH